MGCAYPSLLPSDWRYAAAAARAAGGLHRPPREGVRSAAASVRYGSSSHRPTAACLARFVSGATLMFEIRSCTRHSTLNFTPISRWLESGDHCLPRRQQQSAIHENNGTQFLLVDVKFYSQVLQPQAALESSNHWLGTSSICLAIIYIQNSS